MSTLTEKEKETMQWRANIHDTLKRFFHIRYRLRIPQVVVDAVDAAYVAGLDNKKQEGAISLLYGMKVKTNPYVPEGEIWVGPSKDGVKLSSHFKDKEGER